MVSRIYSPCTVIDDPQLGILVKLLSKVVSHSDLSEEDYGYLDAFLVIFRSHLL